MTADMVLYGTNGKPLQRADPTFDLQSLAQFFTFNGNTYGLGLNQSIVGNREDISGSFVSFARQAFAGNPVVFSCMAARMLLFSEARFQFQQMKQGRPGDLFGTADLAILEHPWPGGTTGDLLSRAIQDADLSGNAFIARRKGNTLRMLRPDYTSIVLGSMSDPTVDSANIDAEIIGYVYHPNGKQARDFEVLLADEVAHFAPYPDPLARYRGMSWITPLIREIQGDFAAEDFKTLYYTNGATPNLVVTFDATVKREAFNDWIKEFEKGHVGIANAYKTLYIGAGTTVQALGSNMQQNDFKSVQGASETRIAAASGIHPVIVGLSEGLQGSSLNAGNFAAAARLTADKTLRPLWRNFAGSMETIVKPPGASRLWYDDRDIPFLKDDEKDRATNLGLQATTINGLVREGFTAASAIEATVSGDFSRLVHTGLFSIQLQAPGSPKLPEGEAPGDVPVGSGTGPQVPKQIAAPQTPKQIPATIKKSAEADQTEVRCSGCGKLLAEFASAPYRMTCPRCKVVTSVGLGPEAVEVVPFEDHSREDRLAADERAERLVVALTAIATREQPTPVVNVSSPVTIAEGAVRVEIAAPLPESEPATVALEWDADGNLVKASAE